MFFSFASKLEDTWITLYTIDKERYIFCQLCNCITRGAFSKICLWLRENLKLFLKLYSNNLDLYEIIINNISFIDDFLIIIKDIRWLDKLVWKHNRNMAI